MITTKDELKRKHNHTSTRILSAFFPAALDTFRAATLPVTGITILEFIGLTIPIPLFALALSATTIGVTCIIQAVITTYNKHLESERKIDEILALNHDPRIKECQALLRQNNKKNEEKLVLACGTEIELSEYLIKRSLQDMLNDLCNHIDSIRENKIFFGPEQFHFNRKVEELGAQFKSTAAQQFITNLYPNSKFPKPEAIEREWYETAWEVTKTYGLDAVKGFIFGVTLAAFIIKLLAPTVLFAAMPYALAIYIPAVVIGITAYLVIGHLKRQADAKAEKELLETEHEQEDKIITLQLLTDSVRLNKLALNDNNTFLTEKLAKR